MVDALGVTSDLGADHTGRIGLLLRAAHAADAAALDHLDIEGTSRGTIMRTGGVADLDLGVLVHGWIRNIEIPASRAQLSGNALAIRCASAGGIARGIVLRPGRTVRSERPGHVRFAQGFAQLGGPIDPKTALIDTRFNLD